MIWNFTRHEQEGRPFMVGLPTDEAPAGKRPAVICHDGQLLEETFRTLSAEKSLNGPAPVVLLLSSRDRMNEYSPWPAPPLNSHSEPFTGGGEGYIRQLEQVFYPLLTESYGCDPDNISLCGYSLGGLITLYAMTRQTCWKKAVSICGSFWYEGWLDYFREHPVLNEKARLLIMEGEKAAKVRNPLLRTSVDCARETFRLAETTNEAQFLLDAGGHNSMVLERHETAFRWLMQD